MRHLDKFIDFATKNHYDKNYVLGKDIVIIESVNEGANYHEYSSEDLRKMYREIARNGSAQQKKVWKQGIKRELDKRGESVNENYMKDLKKLDQGDVVIELDSGREWTIKKLRWWLGSPEITLRNNNDKSTTEFPEDFDDPNFFAWFELKESVNEAKEVEVTQEMWDKEWKIRKTFGKEYDEHFAKRIEAAMSKAKNEEMAENWAFINWKQLPGKADGMTIKESNSIPTKADRLPLFEDFQG